MRLALLTRNKLRFINGSFVKEDFEVDLDMQWERCNALVVSWITGNVSKSLLNGILFKSDACLIWKDLKEKFHEISMSRVFQLHKEIVTLTQGVMSVSAYFSKLKDLCDEYDSIVGPPFCDCDKSKTYVSQQEKQRLLQFLMGLNDGFSQPKSQILMMIPTLTLNQVYAMIIQDESQKHISSGSHGRGDVLEPTAFFTQGGGGGGHRPPQGHRRGYNAVFCDFCNMNGHSREQCFKLLTCDYCNMKGHIKEKCYKLIGYPADFKGKKKAMMVPGGMNQLPPAPHGKHSHQHYQAFLHQNNTGIQSLQQLFFTPEQYNQLIGMINKTTISEPSANLAVGNTGTVQLPNGDSAAVSQVGDYQLS